MGIILDTSFIIGLDNSSDVHHNSAKVIWEKIERGDHGKYFISDYVFDEIIAVTLRKANKNRAIILGKQILKSVQIIKIDTYMFEESWKIFIETKSNLSFTDCTNIVLLKLINSKKIATFDKEFKDIRNVDVVE